MGRKMKPRKMHIQNQETHRTLTNYQTATSLTKSAAKRTTSDIEPQTENNENPIETNENTQSNNQYPLPPEENPLAPDQNPLAPDQNPLAPDQNPLATNENPLATNEAPDINDNITWKGDVSLTFSGFLSFLWFVPCITVEFIVTLLKKGYFKFDGLLNKHVEGDSEESDQRAEISLYNIGNGYPTPAKLAGSIRKKASEATKPQSVSKFLTAFGYLLLMAGAIWASYVFYDNLRIFLKAKDELPEEGISEYSFKHHTESKNLSNKANIQWGRCHSQQ
jgi:hypothetical protein